MPTEKALTYVKDKITTHKVVVFSKTYCPYCIKAKKALATILKPDQMEVIELDNLPADTDGSTIIHLQDALGELTGGRTVPRVFIGGKFIGGGDDTAAKAQSGELAQLLQGVGLP
jgi:glutaredoxin 3